MIKNKKFDKENQRLLKKQARYEELFANVLYNILENIQDVTDSYKGIVDFGSGDDQ